MSDSRPIDLTPSEAVIYDTFWMKTPYSGFRGEMNILWAANHFGVSTRRIREIIAKVNPGYPADEMQRAWERSGGS